MAMTYSGDLRRRAGVVAALAAAAVLSWPGTAHAAEVTSTPGQARQGDAVRLEFVVPEERPGTRTREIEIRLPADAPIAEVYPMSVPGWAPRISSRTLDQPVSGIHSSTVTTVTTAVTWIRVDGAAPGPARLALSMGPLPATDRLAFPVIQTYADGTVVRWADPAGAHKAPVLTLLPAAPGAAGGPAGHAGHGAANGGAANGGAANGGAGPADGAGDPGAAGNAGAPDGAGAVGGAGAPGDAAGARAGNAVAGNTAGGNADALLAAGLLAGLGGGVAVGWLASRWRRRGTTAPAEATDPDDPTERDDRIAPTHRPDPSAAHSPRPTERNSRTGTRHTTEPETGAGTAHTTLSIAPDNPARGENDGIAPAEPADATGDEAPLAPDPGQSDATPTLVHSASGKSR
ncbi:DUF1775 domain-containing protein [Micromonospora sp. WMMD812]|uniref:DUF1775 domain-containing protein n=1 Tax=Micromonospora sp. WMMD812 TaxID=3015152 RepID=UPI00248C2998|nr:DUF1775 domain-containing protein [Micromonospora sp. WMMD812]WBB69754.1 DUF1775 domain-containing protein [Micromonospora sp. WMMD812]